MGLFGKFRIKSFRLTVVALVWVSVSVPVLILCVYQIRDDYEQRLVTNQREIEHETERASFVVSQALRQVMSDLDRVASDGTVIRSLSFPMLSPLSVAKLQAVLDENKSVSTIMSIDHDLFPVEVLPNAALSENLSAYEKFMGEVLGSPESIRDPRPRLFLTSANKKDSKNDKNKKANELTFVRPILTANNSVTQPFVTTGLLFVRIDPQKLIEELQIKTQLSYEFLQLQNQEVSIFESGAKESGNLFLHRAVISLGRDDQSLSIVLGSSANRIMSQVLMAYRMQALMALLFISLMLFITQRLADKLAQPLRVLSKLTSNLSSGQFDQDSVQKIDVGSINYQEFTEVFTLLKNMQATIREQFKQLYEANSHLEEKVAQRTEALEKNLLLLDKQKESLSGLVKYSIEVQQAVSIEEAGLITMSLAERICDQKIGLYVLRSESFTGYQNYSSLTPEYRQFLADHGRELNDYTSLLRFAKNSQRLQVFPIGSSTPSYQGFLVTEKSERSAQTNEAIMVLCTMLGSAIKQHNLNSRLSRLAHIDSVTHLPNRHYFNSKFNEKLNAFNETDIKTHFGIFVIDVNGLKTINDNYGHQFGDDMLKVVATAIKKLARANDTVARVGGDEFYIILENARVDSCEHFATRLKDASAELTMKIEGNVIPISFSYGFASTDLDSLKNLIQLADERMYFAKKKYYKKI